MTISFLILVAFIFAAFYSHKSRQLIKLPSVGYEGPLTSYLSAFRFIKEGNVVLQEGYNKYKHRAFKVPMIDRWLVVVSGEEFFESLCTAPSHALSMWAAMIDLMQMDDTLGSQMRKNPYHFGVIRSLLKRNLFNLLPSMLDEMVAVFADEINAKFTQSEWTPIPALDTFNNIVCRISNRAFVGLPVCRNKEYCKLNIEFSKNVMAGSAIISVFPSFLRPLAGMVFNKIVNHQKRMAKLLGPEIEERRRKMKEFGTDYPGKPNDMLSWLMDAAPSGLEQTTHSLALRMLNVNFMGIHSTSVCFTHALYFLASRPSMYVNILRSEVEANLGVQNEDMDWSEESLEKCYKLDSFLKESIRLTGIGALSLPRKAMVSYTLPDGSIIPPGTIISIAAAATQLDDANYERAQEFDGFRFSSLREQNSARKDSSRSVGDDARHRLSGAGPNFLIFGGGKHLCPGRFFSALELKCMMAYLLLHYDVKTIDEGVRPDNEWFGPICSPARDAKVLFRRRQA